MLLIKRFAVFLVGCLLIGAYPILAQPSDQARRASQAFDFGQVKQVAVLGKGGVNQIGISSDGKTLGVATSIGIWLYQTNDMRRPPYLLQSGFAATGAIAFGRDSDTLASADDDGTLRLWSLRERKPVRSVSSQDKLTDPIYSNSIALSPDGKIIAAGSEADRKSSVRVWSLETSKELTVLQTHDDCDIYCGIHSLAFSPNGTLLAAAVGACCVQVWNVNTGLRLFELPTGYVRSVRFSPDGTLIAASGMDGVELWDSVTGKRKAMLAGRNIMTGPGAAFTSDGKTIAVGDLDEYWDGIIHLWDVAQVLQMGTTKPGMELGILEGHSGVIVGLSFGSDANTLFSSGSDGTVRRWDLKVRRQTGMIGGFARHTSGVSFSADGKLLAGAFSASVLESGEMRDVRLWNVATLVEQDAGWWRDGFVTSVAFSPVSPWLAVGGGTDYYPEHRGSDDVLIWDIRSSSSRYQLKGHEATVWSVAFSADGTLLASGSNDSTVRIWDTRTGKPLTVLQGHTGEVSSVAFSPDGTLLASASDDKTVRLWHTRTGKLLYSLQGHTGEVSSVAFSPDGTLLASASGDKTVRLWDTRTGKSLKVLQGHTDGVHSVAFSPDGTALISGGRDKILVVWSTRDWHKAAVLTGHTDWITQIAFALGGRLMATSSMDGTIRLWSIQ